MYTNTVTAVDFRSRVIITMISLQAVLKYLANGLPSHALSEGSIHVVITYGTLVNYVVADDILEDASQDSWDSPKHAHTTIREPIKGIIIVLYLPIHNLTIAYQMDVQYLATMHAYNTYDYGFPYKCRK